VQYVAGSLDVRVFVDSDDVADAIARRSTAELFVRLGDAVRLWGVKCYHSVGISTCGAEEHAMTSGAQDFALGRSHP
jgi:hypothetical protein